MEPRQQQPRRDTGSGTRTAPRTPGGGSSRQLGWRDQLRADVKGLSADEGAEHLSPRTGESQAAEA